MFDGLVAKNVAFSPDGSHLAVSGRGEHGRGGVIEVWDWPSRQPSVVLAGHEAGINALAYSPDGSRIASGDSLGVVNLWDVETGRKRASLAASPRKTIIQAVAFSPDGSLVATAGFLEDDVRLWDSAMGGPRGTVPGSLIGTNALAFSPDGSLLVMARGDGAATLWNLAERRIAGNVTAPGGSLQSLTFLGDGHEFVTGGADGVVRHWDLAMALCGKSDGEHPGPPPSGPRRPESESGVLQ
jgi:WD40 repeat protein